MAAMGIGLRHICTGRTQGNPEAQRRPVHIPSGGGNAAAQYLHARADAAVYQCAGAVQPRIHNGTLRYVRGRRQLYRKRILAVPALFLGVVAFAVVLDSVMSFVRIGKAAKA